MFHSGVACPNPWPVCAPETRAPVLSPGVYKKEEAHLLLRAFQTKGPADVFVSKFDSDPWGLDGYVSGPCGGGAGGGAGRRF